MKKAAMFGLDARIALAIFGSLSVILGAILLSVIEDVKATVILTELNELGKAWEQFYLDNLQSIPVVSTSDNTNYKFYEGQTRYLLEKPADFKNWKGPYLKHEVNYNYLKDSKGHVLYANIINDEVWGQPTNDDWSDSGICSSAKKCYAWVGMSGFDDISLFRSLDKKIDKGDGGNKGSIRWDSPAAYPVVKNRIWLKYSAIKNPND